MSTQASHSRGFTLLELLVVIAILGLLIGYVAPRYFGQVSHAEVKSAQNQMDAIAKALEQYRLDMGRYPSAGEGLTALLQSPAMATERWRGPYLKKAVPPDPWGGSYRYEPLPAQDQFRLSSLGRDGRPGGSGADADLNQ